MVSPEQLSITVAELAEEYFRKIRDLDDKPQVTALPNARSDVTGRGLYRKGAWRALRSCDYFESLTEHGGETIVEAFCCLAVIRELDYLFLKGGTDSENAFVELARLEESGEGAWLITFLKKAMNNTAIRATVLRNQKGRVNGKSDGDVFDGLVANLKDGLQKAQLEREQAKLVSSEPGGAKEQGNAFATPNLAQGELGPTQPAST